MASTGIWGKNSKTDNNIPYICQLHVYAHIYT